VFALLTLSGTLFAQGRSEEGLDRAIAAQEKHADALMAKPGVVGTAVGLNDDAGHVVLVLLEKAGVGGIPKGLEGVAVRVMVTGKIHALADPTARFDRPVPIGVSTGHPDITAGTIGCRVKDASGNVYALSNNHVYAASNNALIGDNVLQPGAYDGGVDPGDAIGTLFDFEPIVFHPRANNTIDAAIALSDTDSLGNATPSDGYGIPSSITAEAALGVAVQKYGRTTGPTTGEITGINATVRVRYSSGSARFVGQIIIEPGGFSEGGDSGSLIVTDDPDNSANDKRPVGLLFAGSSTVTIANAIGLVLERFGVTIDDDDTPAPPPNDPPTVSITSPADGEIFSSGSSISFAGTASDTEDGDLTVGLSWTSSIDGSIGAGASFSYALSDGTHTITASVTDSGGKTGSDSISITVGTPPAEPTTVIVDSITYRTIGGGRHLLATVALVDDLGDPVAGASVSIDLYLDGGLYTEGTGTTGADGTLTYKLNSAPSGTYTTDVTSVTAAGLIWDKETPENSFTK